MISLMRTPSQNKCRGDGRGSQNIARRALMTIDQSCATSANSSHRTAASNDQSTSQSRQTSACPQPQPQPHSQYSSSEHSGIKTVSTGRCDAADDLYINGMPREGKIVYWVRSVQRISARHRRQHYNSLVTVNQSVNDPVHGKGDGQRHAQRCWVIPLPDEFASNRRRSADTNTKGTSFTRVTRDAPLDRVPRQRNRS